MANNVYSVKQVNSYIKNMFATDYMLKSIYVKGEVSNCKYHTSGHIYFSLKDESGTIACVMFAGQRSGLAFRMEEGQEVVVLGSVSVYERSGSYQLYAREIRLDGEGILYEKFKALKTKLEEMGMFDAGYKRSLPFYPETIGIITAPTGAAIRDIINVSTRRNPYTQLLLYPAKVQGEGAAKSIVKGIELLNRKGVDVIILGRGGGSIEDLWAFNEEEVAEAIFNSAIPIVSAVGHETDFTIADFVSDLRAPTPSAAAELVVPDYKVLKSTVEDYKNKLYQGMNQRIILKKLKLNEFLTKMKFLHPENRLRQKQQYSVELENMLITLMQSKLISEKHKLAIYIETMKHLSPLHKLSKGYAYVSDENGKAITSIHDVKESDNMEIYVTDGRIKASILELKEEDYGSKERKS